MRKCKSFPHYSHKSAVLMLRRPRGANAFPVFSFGRQEKGLPCRINNDASALTLSVKSSYKSLS